MSCCSAPEGSCYSSSSYRTEWWGRAAQKHWSCCFTNDSDCTGRGATAVLQQMTCLTWEWLLHYRWLIEMVNRPDAPVLIILIKLFSFLLILEFHLISFSLFPISSRPILYYTQPPFTDRRLVNNFSRQMWSFSPFKNMFFLLSQIEDLLARNRKLCTQNSNLNPTQGLLLTIHNVELWSQGHSISQYAATWCGFMHFARNCGGGWTVKTPHLFFQTANNYSVMNVYLLEPKLIVTFPSYFS